ncbi:spore wall protein 1-like [Copidosoma floridanum]|uniref:spore wall protein 1-like n=1 Tax=Copidosoma floridanum TaxID=29053 RepID=UPI0006C9B221|nr:spore wall protein 1-like [Copidosoma floridanum]
MRTIVIFPVLLAFMATFGCSEAAGTSVNGILDGLGGIPLVGQLVQNIVGGVMTLLSTLFRNLSEFLSPSSGGSGSGDSGSGSSGSSGSGSGSSGSGSGSSGSGSNGGSDGGSSSSGNSRRRR